MPCVDERFRDLQHSTLHSSAFECREYLKDRQTSHRHSEFRSSRIGCTVEETSLVFAEG
jgi:hypothetical protein